MIDRMHRRIYENPLKADRIYTERREATFSYVFVSSVVVNNGEVFEEIWP